MRWLSVVVVCASWTLTSALPSAQATLAGPLPFSEGAEIEAWRISAIKRHPEFVRLTLTKEASRAHVEIVAAKAPGPWSTRHYRVQPAPGLEASKEALGAMLSALASWEDAPGHRPFFGGQPESVERRGDATSRGPPAPALKSQAKRQWPPEGRWFWLALNLLALSALASCLKAGPRASKALTWLGVALSAGLLAALSLDPRALPSAWITVLQEGSVASVIASLHGEGHHGAAFDSLIWLFADDEGLRIRGVVKANLTLTLMNLLGVAGITWALSARLSLSILSATAWALAPLQVNAAWSDLPSALIGSYTLMGALALGCLNHAPRRALALLALLSLLLAGVRLEWGALGAVTFLSMLAPRLLGEERRARLNGPLLSFGLLLLGYWVINGVGMIGEGTSASAPEAWRLWQGQGGGIVGWGIFSWPLGLLASWPVGLVILALLGGARALMRPLSWSAAIVAMLLLQGVYWTSAHKGDAPFEVLRYASLMGGLGACLVALGWQVICERFAERRGGAAVILMLAALCLVPTPGDLFRGELEGHHAESPGPLYEMPLSRHLQAEARALMAAYERYPECIIATVSAIEPSATREVEAYSYVFFGGSLVNPLETARSPGNFGALLDSLAAGSECVLVHRGLDCHIQGGPDCREEVGGAHFISGVERLQRPYYDHVYRREPVRLELWRRRGALPQAEP